MSEAKIEKGNSLWKDAWKRLCRDKIVVLCMIIIALYLLVALLAFIGVIGADWEKAVGESYQPPSWKHWMGTDIFGRDVWTKIYKGAEIAMGIGFFSTLIAVPIGVFLGAVAGYFGGRVDEFIVWLYTTFSSIPRIILLMSITYVLGRDLTSVYVALGATSWIGLCRMIRSEVLKHKNREYIQAASSIGLGHARKLFKHIIPNVFHLVIIFGSMNFIYSIKSEVILSFLGIGANGKSSWGIMISDARLELSQGVWWQLFGATFAMFFIVLAFNLLGDALRDALDPKLKGRD